MITVSKLGLGPWATLGVDLVADVLLLLSEDRVGNLLELEFLFLLFFRWFSLVLRS